MNIRRLAAWAVIFSGLLIYVLAFEKPVIKPQQPSQRGDYEKIFGLAQGDIAGLAHGIDFDLVQMKIRLVWQGQAHHARLGIPGRLGCHVLVFDHLQHHCLGVPPVGTSRHPGPQADPGVARDTAVSDLNAL